MDCLQLSLERTDSDLSIANFPEEDLPPVSRVHTEWSNRPKKDKYSTNLRFPEQFKHERGWWQGRYICLPE